MEETRFLRLIIGKDLMVASLLAEREESAPITGELVQIGQEGQKG